MGEVCKVLYSAAPFKENGGFNLHVWTYEYLLSTEGLWSNGVVWNSLQSRFDRIRIEGQRPDPEGLNQCGVVPKFSPSGQRESELTLTPWNRIPYSKGDLVIFSGITGALQLISVVFLRGCWGAADLLFQVRIYTLFIHGSSPPVGRWVRTRPVTLFQFVHTCIISKTRAKLMGERAHYRALWSPLTAYFPS